MDAVMSRRIFIPAYEMRDDNLKEIIDVEGMKPEDYINVKSFDTLTAINPERWLKLEIGAQPITNRVIDLLAAGIFVENRGTGEAEELGVGEKLFDGLVILTEL